MSTAMAREIDEIPAIVERAVADGAGEVAGVAAAIRAFRPCWVSFVARGTSDHVATYGRYLVEVATGLPAGLAAASVTTIYGATRRWDRGLVIAISQSGRSPDLVAVVEAARAGGALTVVITNDPGSPLADAGEHVLPCRAGPERAVAATKTYVACLVTLAALVGAWTGRASLAHGLARLPGVLATALEIARPWVRDAGVTADLAAADRTLVVSRGYDYATALEVAIKLQETAGLFAAGYSTADLEHGPVALAGPDVPVLAFRPDGEAGRRIDGALERVRAGGGRTWLVGGQEPPTVARDPSSGAHPLRLPLALPPELQPAVLVLPGLLIAEQVARARGRDPDRPAGLTKITLTT